MPILTRGKALVTLLLIVTFLKGIVWAIAIPIWHAPDEAAHFAQVQYFAEFNRMPVGRDKDKSNELLQSEILLGTLRDEHGNNKFTYHPEYRIEYTKTLEGKYEKEIENIPASQRTNMVKQESSRYPPLYYLLGGIFYRLVYASNIITRAFSVRLVSIFSLVLMTYFSYKIGWEVFKNKISALSLALLVSFQPMNTFVSSGVTSDSLGNAIFSVILFFCLKIINYGLDLKNVTLLAISIGLGLFSKPQATVAIAFAAFAFFLSIIKNKIGIKKILSLIPIFLIILTLSGGYRPIVKAYQNWKESGVFLPYIETGTIPDAQDITFFSFFNWTVKHTISEVLPWYWGVFNWLGVVLPRVVNQIIVRLMLVSTLGIFIYFLKIIRKRKLPSNFFPVIFILFSSAVYFLAITVMDYAHFKSHNFSLGIQGRYFFPTIVAHMTLLLLGFQEIFKSSKILVILMIILNFIGLKTLIDAYYNTSNINTFLIQISQYKPEVLKGNNLVIIFSVYLALLFTFLLKFIRIKEKNDKDS